MFGQYIYFGLKNAKLYNKNHYFYKFYLKFLQIPNTIAKMKDSEKSITNQRKFEF